MFVHSIIKQISILFVRIDSIDGKGMMIFMKRVYGILLAVTLFFTMCLNVYASQISVNDVVEEFSKTKIISLLNSLGSSISANIDTVNNKININDSGETLLSLNYTDEYIEYDNRSAVITEDNYEDTTGSALCMEGIVETIFNLSGYSDKTLDDYEAPISYDEYGIQIETGDYEFSGTDEDGGTWTSSGKYVKYFKISLDSEKIVKLVESYGTTINDDYTSVFINDVPTIELKDITANSITIYATVEGYDEDSNKIPYCSIYRSTSADGDYEEITDAHVACIGEVGITDENLQSGTTYYYKAKVVGGSEFSEVVKVTTLTTDTVKVPNTSNSKFWLLYIIGLVLIIAGSGFALYVKNKTK